VLKSKSPIALPTEQNEQSSRRNTTDRWKSGALKKTRAGVKQYSVHLKESTHRNVKIALLLAGGKQDFSGLVEELLTQYLRSQKVNVQDLKVQND
jgi:hypothetical protein